MSTAGLPRDVRAGTMPPVSAPDLTDGELIEEIAAGDRGAFDELYVRYARAVLGLSLRRLGDRGRAEDAVQEAFAAIWRSARTYDRARGAGASWLYAVARNALDAACAAGAGALRMRPVALSRAALIQTVTEGDDGEKGHRAIQKRLSALQVQMQPKQIVPHREAELAAALGAVSGADLILILTASATSDPNDVAPQALRRAGGTVRPTSALACGAWRASLCRPTPARWRPLA